MIRLINIILLATLISYNNFWEQINNPGRESLNDVSIKAKNADTAFFGEKLPAVVNKISQINEVQYEYVGITGTESENYKNFKKLKAIATINELLQLTDNKNPVVACYAGWALADKSYLGLKAIFSKFLLQKSEVRTFSGCIKSQDQIASELYHRYWNHTEDKKKPTDKILIELDSIILFGRNVNWLLTTRALENRIYQEPFKRQIEKLAFEQGNGDAIYYFCNWYRAEYKDKIKLALIKYLNKTDFKETGTTDYYRILDELFRFKDPRLEKVIITKLKKDRSWENEKERFNYLLEDNCIYNIDNQ